MARRCVCSLAQWCPNRGADAGPDLMTRLAIAASAALALVFAMSATPAVAQPAPPATCSTFNASSEPSSTFAPGEKLTVRGTGFGPRSHVLVSLQQGIRTVELAEATANDLGAFSASGAQIPDTVVGGKASIRALDARGSAVCGITVSGSAKNDESGLGVLYVVWGTMLALFGLFLVVLTYRRWKAERLREAVDQLAARGEEDARPSDHDEADDEREQLPVLSGRGRPAGDRRERYGASWAGEPLRQPEDGGEDVSDEWAFREHAPARWARDTPREPALVRRSTGGDVASAEPDDVDAPPVLAEGWDAGRLRSGRRASEAIERLRREVGTWKKP